MNKNPMPNDLEYVPYCRRSTDSQVYHSDRGSRNTSIRYTDHLAEVGIELSVGSRGNRYNLGSAEELYHRTRPEAMPINAVLPPSSSLEAVHTVSKL